MNPSRTRRLLTRRHPSARRRSSTPSVVGPRSTPVADRVTVRVVEHGVASPTTLPQAGDAVLLPVAPRRQVALALPDRLVLSLGPRLGPTWRLTDESDPALDIAVELGADPERVRSLVAQHRGLAVLSLLPSAADPSLVVRMLEAGAEGCLRGEDPVEVGAHLQAMERRCTGSLVSA